MNVTHYIDSKRNKVKELSKKLMNIGIDDFENRMRNIPIYRTPIKWLQGNRHSNIQLNYYGQQY